MSAKKIPPSLHAELFKRSDAGDDSEDLAQWLWREHKIEISSRGIRSLIRKRRTELADVAKSVVRDELRKHLLKAIERIERVGARAARMVRHAEARAEALHTQHQQHPQALNELFFALKAQDRVLKAGNLLLHYAGLNQPDTPGAAAMKIGDARQALLNRIEKLAAAPEPKTEPPVH